jgi:hypothetical protein
MRHTMPATCTLLFFLASGKPLVRISEPRLTISTFPVNLLPGAVCPQLSTTLHNFVALSCIIHYEPLPSGCHSRAVDTGRRCSSAVRLEEPNERSFNYTLPLGMRRCGSVKRLKIKNACRSFGKVIFSSLSHHRVFPRPKINTTSSTKQYAVLE